LRKSISCIKCPLRGKWAHVKGKDVVGGIIGGGGNRRSFREDTWREA